jgi:hypothetical protein
MTGARKAPIDRRRVRGANRGLKELLVEGFNGGGEPARPWRDFSGAMIRQSVDEAVNSLPTQHKQVVKLAYFGGLSNNEIAHELGMPVGGVRRRLRQALAAVSAYVERGQAAGRRAVYGLAGWLMARSIVDHAQRAPATHQILQAALVVAAGAGAAVLLVASPAVPAQHGQTSSGGVHSAAPGSSGSVPAAKAVAPAVKVALPGVSTSAPDVPSVPGVIKVPTLPINPGLKVRVPAKVAQPAITIPPVKHWL